MSKKLKISLGIVVGIAVIWVYLNISSMGRDQNALAQQLADVKVKEITAEQQLQLWTTQKTQLTKQLAELNGKISDSVKTANPIAVPFQ